MYGSDVGIVLCDIDHHIVCTHERLTIDCPELKRMDLMGCNNRGGRQMDTGTQLCMVGHRSQRSVIWKRRLDKRRDMQLSYRFCK